MKISLGPSLVLSLSLLPACAGIAKSNAEYKQAKEAFAADQDQQTAAADAGYSKGMEIYEAYMADGPPPTPTSVADVQDWIDQRWVKIEDAEQAFEPVHNLPMGERGYRTHLALGTMVARLGEEVMAGGEALPPEENQTLHRGGGALDIFDRGHKHLNAWEAAGYNDVLADDKDALASEIEAAHAKRDRMQELREKSIAIGEGKAD